jgi:hypothetical protein
MRRWAVTLRVDGTPCRIQAVAGYPAAGKRDILVVTMRKLKWQVCFGMAVLIALAAPRFAAQTAARTPSSGAPAVTSGSKNPAKSGRAVITQGESLDGRPLLRQYCLGCHGKAAMGGLNLEKLMAEPSSGFGGSFEQWRRVALALEQHRMPPKPMPQPDDPQRSQMAAWIRSELGAYARKHDGNPGRVTMRRLTSGEYAYTIQDLTGYAIEAGIDASSDSAGGEGFTNFGDVQFVETASIERYLDAAKRVADHAVIGSGPLEFYRDPGKTGFENSALNRIREIYAREGFRTVSGEGGRPFGLEKYGKAFYAAWRYKHRAALGTPKVELKDLAAKEGINPRFAEHISAVVNSVSSGYPVSEAAARWRKLPVPGSAASDEAAVRAECEKIQNFIVTWPSWLFARGDLAAGGAGDESPLQFSDETLKAQAKFPLRFNAFNPGFFRNREQGMASSAMKAHILVAPVNPHASAKTLVVWRNPTIAFRTAPARPAPSSPTAASPGGEAAPDASPAKPAAAPNPAAAAATQASAGDVTAGRRFPPAGPKQPLSAFLDKTAAAQLNFGAAPEGIVIGPGDFVTTSGVSFEVKLPEGAIGYEFQATAELAGDPNQVLRVIISERADGGSVRGRPTWALLADPSSEGYRAFKAGVFELATNMPPNSHGEPTPADKDPIPEPFDNTYNVPEHDEFVVKIKYLRDDRFAIDKLLDKGTGARLDHAWNDLYASFEYHDNYLNLLAKHYKFDLKGKKVADLDEAQVNAMPPDLARYARPVRAEYQRVMAAQAAARPGHLEDSLKFAAQAWRRPLTVREKESLRAFYDSMITSGMDHRQSIRALIARVLVAPAFLYRVEQAADVAAAKPLTQWELASRLSYFLWSSIPDAELSRAASAGELADPAGIQRQVKRMLKDAKARRLSTEFFGQWLGFYHFDQHRGVDTTRFPEFTDEVRDAMYDEAVTFFEHVIRKDRPVRELLSADYTFLNQALAKHYSINKKVASTEDVEIVEGVGEFRRGGLLRLGAVLTATSAPLRTSPVKRGDWILRRVLGTHVPPPPADAGSLPADDKLFGGLTLREKLEAHKRNPTCAGCHVRIDPLGFPLEHYDSIGRWREKYPDGKAIDDFGVFADNTRVEGIDGLVGYLQSQEKQFLETLAAKLTGYALGRTVQASDQVLIERMAAGGGGTTFSQMAGEIAASRQFRNRLGREAAPAVKTAALRAGANSQKAGAR